MRKRLKNKRRACGLCKPHKRNMDNRWKDRERERLRRSEREIQEAVRRVK